MHKPFLPISCIFLVILLVFLTGLCLAQTPGEPSAQSRKYASWQKGIVITTPNENVRIKFNAKLHGDAGVINAGQTMENDFPEFTGDHARWRRARLALSADFGKWVDLKLEYDFVGQGAFKDVWIRFPNTPVLNHFLFGHFKEPFGLENVTSSSDYTFMEKALPSNAFSLGRNLGVMAHGPVMDKRATWSAGAFFNTGNFNLANPLSDNIDQDNGYNLTARLTALPWFDPQSGRLAHLGLSYSHLFRQTDDSSPRVRFRTRPENNLTDTRLVETPKFQSRGIDQADLETAWVFGSLSLQGELFYSHARSEETYGFWGWYAHCSYLLTGEKKKYNQDKGVFSAVKPLHNFDPREKGAWGAWELALRYSYLNLNSKDIQGGKEANWTLGVNWYLFPRTRWMLNYTVVRVTDREKPLIERANAQILASRIQITF